MQVLIVNESKSRIPRKFIESWIQQLSLELKKKKIINAKQNQAELILVFLNKKPAQKINNEFRGKNYATDVLSFESMDSSNLGELILCPEVLRKQAMEHGLTFQKELGYMLLHGVLHLLGYDHETNEKDAKEMFHLQDMIFEILLNRFS